MKMLTPVPILSTEKRVYFVPNKNVHVFIFPPKMVTPKMKMLLR